jgi:precorrin-6A synthase
MQKVLLIGIGAGDPEYLTVQAVNALNAADVFFVLEKAQDELVQLRREIIERYGSPPRRIATATDPPRGRDVAAWRRTRVDVCARLLREAR